MNRPLILRSRANGLHDTYNTVPMLRYLYLDTNEHGYLDWNLSKKEKKRLEWMSGDRSRLIPYILISEVLPILRTGNQLL